MHKQKRPVPTLVHELRAYMDEKGIGQKEAADRAKISQATVSRILDGRVKRHTGSLLQLCKVAKIHAYDEIEADPSKNELLVQALRETWDGSAEHAKALARVIKSLRGFEGVKTKAGD